MKLTRVAATLVALGFVSSPASATIIQIDFNGVLTGTRDVTGTLYGNGTADNSSVGLSISGSILWDVPTSQACNLSGGYCLYDQDLGLHPQAAEDLPLHWSITFGGVEINSDLNYGTRNTVFLYDQQSGAAQDQWNARLYAFGHFPTEPEVNGQFDSLNVQQLLNLNFTDPSGATIQGLDFTAPIDWTSGIDGSGTGSFSTISQIWENGNAGMFTGTPGAILESGSGSFVLTSVKSTAVPEPESLALFAIGLAALFVGRRKTLAA